MTRRQQKTRQRAEEQLGVAERIAARLADKCRNLAVELVAVEAERDAAVVRRDYLANHPDLKPTGDVPLPLSGDTQ